MEERAPIKLKEVTKNGGVKISLKKKMKIQKNSNKN